MARYTKESLQNLRSHIDLVEVLSAHMQLKRQGAAFKGLCPFHDEKTPSFIVNRGDTHYHCFGCGAHGDAIQFLMQHVRLKFGDAVEQLAERYGVALDTIERTKEEKTTSRVRLKEALDAALRFYQFSLLHSKEWHEALSYLDARCVSLDFIEKFRVGYAPRQDATLRAYMHTLGYRDDELVEAGLLNDRKKEFFHDRIIFAILDQMAMPIGFSARKFKENTFGGKYINTRETPLFKKSKVLFGLSHSRRQIIKQKLAIVVEGGLDALRMIHHGFDTTVAALGTAFGQEHVQELITLGITKVYLLFDGDTAGRDAAVKTGDFFQKKGIEVLVGVLSKGQDPDSLLVRDGPIAITDRLIHAQEYLSFLHTVYMGQFQKDSPAEKQRILSEIVQRIRDWESPVMVHESLKKLSSLANVPQELLGVGALRSPNLYVKSSHLVQAKLSVDPDRVIEADLLRWLVLYGHVEKQMVELCKAHLHTDDFRLLVAKNLYPIILEFLEQEKPIDIIGLVQESDSDETQSFLSEIVARKVNREKAIECFTLTIQRIKERNWMQACDAIQEKIQKASGDEDKLMQYVKEFDAIKKQKPQVVL